MVRLKQTVYRTLLTNVVSTKQKAIRAAIAVVAGGYQTALVSYFVHRDFFPALMNVSRSWKAQTSSY